METKVITPNAATGEEDFVAGLQQQVADQIETVKSVSAKANRLFNENLELRAELAETQQQLKFFAISAKAFRAANAHYVAKNAELEQKLEAMRKALEAISRTLCRPQCDPTECPSCIASDFLAKTRETGTQAGGG